MPIRTRRVKKRLIPPAPKIVAKTSKKEPKKNPLYEKRPKNFAIGGDIQPKRDLTRFVRWPRYIRLQRQKRVLLLRLKVMCHCIYCFTRIRMLDTSSEKIFVYRLGLMH